MKPLLVDMQAFGPFADRQLIDFSVLGQKTSSFTGLQARARRPSWMPCALRSLVIVQVVSVRATRCAATMQMR